MLKVAPQKRFRGGVYLLDQMISKFRIAFEFVLYIRYQFKLNETDDM